MLTNEELDKQAEECKVLYQVNIDHIVAQAKEANALREQLESQLANAHKADSELADRLEALLEKVTPGPWIVAHDQYFTMDEKRLMVELVNNAPAIIAALRKP